MATDRKKSQIDRQTKGHTFRRTERDSPDQRGAVLPDVFVVVFKTSEDGWENLRFDDHFGQVDGMLGDLAQSRENLTLQLGVRVQDHLNGTVASKV